MIEENLGLCLNTQLRHPLIKSGKIKEFKNKSFDTNLY